VEVDGQFLHWDLLELFEEGDDFLSGAPANSIPQGDLVAPEVEELVGDLGNFGGTDFSFIGAAHHHRYIPSDFDIIFLCLFDNRLEPFEGHFNGAVDIFL
jgi:hypothetical protein